MAREEKEPIYLGSDLIGYVREKFTGYWATYDTKGKLKQPGRDRKGFTSSTKGGRPKSNSGFHSKMDAVGYLRDMATKRRNPIRRRRRNSAVRMDDEDFVINPEQDEVTITIKAPKDIAESLSSDLSMLAMQKDIPNTRGNPRKRKAAKKRKRSPRMKKVFGNPITHLPKTKAKTGTHAFVGRPTHDKWFIADLYDANQKKIISHYGRGGKKEAETEAQDFLDRRAKSRGGKSRTVKSVIFSGPYSRKPNAKTRRK
jgi:hypothetical protein